jgi:peptidoglycan/LPS O-acetylase OafA/YrhL
MARASEAGARVLVLDGWRGLAIIGVLLDHFITSEFLNLGRFGVELFFVLSGRLMAEILFVKNMPLRLFFPRRFSRVYPALFCFVTLLFAASALFRWFDFHLFEWVAALTFTMNYVSIYYNVSPAIDHIWSLSIEEHMYLLLGVIAALNRWRSLPVLPILIGLIILAIANGAYQTWAWHLHYHNVYWRTDVRGASILISVAFYLWLSRQTERPAILTHPLTPVIFTFVALVLSINAVPDPIKYSVGTLLLAISVAILQEAPPWFSAFLSSRWLVLAGVGSYSLYLWQQPFALIKDMDIKFGLFPVIMVIAMLSYNFVEQPARAGLNKLFARLHSTRVAPKVELAAARD